MKPRRKSSLLWGLIGALIFLVLAVGYHLLGGILPVGPVGIGAIAVAVGGVVTVVSPLLETRLLG